MNMYLIIGGQSYIHFATTHISELYKRDLSTMDCSARLEIWCEYGVKIWSHNVSFLTSEQIKNLIKQEYLNKE